MSQPSLSGLVPPTVAHVLDLARRHLQMDLAFVSAIRDGKQVYEALDGEVDTFALGFADGTPLEDTYCRLMVEGGIPNVICDSSADPRVAHLKTTADGPIGAYIGVPLRLGDGTLYGTFCCLSHTAQPLAESDVRFMRMLGELVVEDLERQRAQDEKRAAVAHLIEHDALDVALQPIVAVDDGRCLGFEALSRFAPGAGTPDVVFANAAEVGLGLELERLAARDAYALLPRLPGHAYLSVNLSPGTAYHLAEDWARLLVLPLDRLVLEITEHEAVKAYAELRERLQPLRDRGLRLAIDDAGAGFASLSHVVELRPDVIKVDRSLVHGLAQDRARRTVVGAFVALAHGLDATVVAEGVETADELDAAVALGVDAVQGYHVARPSTGEADHARWAQTRTLLPPRAVSA